MEIRWCAAMRTHSCTSRQFAGRSDASALARVGNVAVLSAANLSESAITYALPRTASHSRSAELSATVLMPLPPRSVDLLLVCGVRADDLHQAPRSEKVSSSRQSRPSAAVM